MENRANPMKVLTIYIQYDTLKQPPYTVHIRLFSLPNPVSKHTLIPFYIFVGMRAIQCTLFVTCSCWHASQAWMEWLRKKTNAFDQRGDMAIAAWAEQQ
ncbi:hypothetical protein Hanom_Chr09g00833851 [Helianthus anomalus]